MDIDMSRNLLKLSLGGFYAPEDVARLAGARAEALVKLGCPPNRHLTLADVREMKIQPPETVVAFATMMDDNRYRSRKMAFVCPPSLARMQLMRVAQHRVARLFVEPGAAERWLFSDDESDTLDKNSASAMGAG
ncbi:hypothetical protein [Stakelama tenebrarum]|uniref:Uncharacterized protein n=1 Tax=Stakelama tenebrarum TaxID=2711215 RepID=A0A6G6Y8S8_9SPHN|nr:hypothetical protein [Sphingosinithalassobacter tenebrarum]QIG81207.1 hypothetical protein G5C33_16440 [Sphingosinithalassobacter tenebrarum]